MARAIFHKFSTEFLNQLLKFKFSKSGGRRADLPESYIACTVRQSVAPENNNIICVTPCGKIRVDLTRPDIDRVAGADSRRTGERFGISSH